MDTILSPRVKRPCNLSDEVYEIISWETEYGILKRTENYAIGKKVRLISGVHQNDTPGYHFNGLWTTVCAVSQITEGVVNFMGFPKAALKLVKPINRLIHVTENDINHGVRECGSSCMISVALNRVFGKKAEAYASYAVAGSGEAFCRVNGVKYTMSPACRQRMEDFDAWKVVKPFAFRMKLSER